MNRNKLYLSLSGLVMLMTILACVIPGQATQPAPIVDPNVIQTSIAGTAQTITEQTVQAVLASTDTPIVPVETATPQITISSYGTSLTKREDGSTQFVDHRAGVQIIFPSNWLAMRAGESEYYQAWENEGRDNPNLLDAITSIQNLDLNRFRVTAYDTHPEHIIYDNLPKINVVFVQDDTRTLKEVEADEIKNRPPVTDYKLLSSEFQEISGGLEILIIQYEWQSATPANQFYTGFYHGVLFKVPTGTVAIDLFIPLDQKEPLELELNQIIGSITLFNP